MAMLEENKPVRESANGKCDYNLVMLTNKKTGALFLKRDIIQEIELYIYVLIHILSSSPETCTLPTTTTTAPGFE